MAIQSTLILITYILINEIMHILINSTKTRCKFTNESHVSFKYVKLHWKITIKREQLHM